MLCLADTAHSPQVNPIYRTVGQRKSADCEVRNKDSKVTLRPATSNTVTGLVNFYCWAGDCCLSPAEMMSAHLAPPVISTASAAETATWAEDAVCSCVSMCVDVEKLKWGSWLGLHEDWVQCTEKKNWYLYLDTQSKTKEQKNCSTNMHTQSEITTTITTKRYQTSQDRTQRSVDVQIHRCFHFWE